MKSDGQWCMSDNDVCMRQVAEWIMKVKWEMQMRERGARTHLQWID